MKVPKKGTKSWYKYHCQKMAKLAVLKRDGYKCQYCGLDRSERQIQASHVMSVHVHDYLQADLLNIKALCSYHHRYWWHSSPIDAYQWFADKFPERLKYLNKQAKKRTPPDWEALYHEMKSNQ